jgi:hypothetical protein
VHEKGRAILLQMVLYLLTIKRGIAARKELLYTKTA